MESGLPRTLRLKRNALDDDTVRGIHRFFADLPKRSRAVTELTAPVQPRKERRNAPS